MGPGAHGKNSGAKNKEETPAGHSLRRKPATKVGSRATGMRNKQIRATESKSYSEQRTVRIDASKCSDQEASHFQSAVDGKQPAVISGIWSDEEREDWVERLFNRYADADVIFQARTAWVNSSKRSDADSDGDDDDDVGQHSHLAKGPPLYNKGEHGSESGHREEGAVVGRPGRGHDGGSQSAATSLLESTLGDFVELCFESGHDASYFLLDEDLLGDFDRAECELRSTRALRGIRILPQRPNKHRLELPSMLFPDGDWFNLFPSPVRPKQPCLIMGGAGARSSLHCDPMSWTGWNYLVEGSKLWTLFPPDDDDGDDEDGGGDELGLRDDPAQAAAAKSGASRLEESLSSKRLESSAWDEGVYNISAGWESPFDLYHRRLPGNGQSGDWPSASALGVMPTVTRDDALKRIQKAAQNEHPFAPSSQRLDLNGASSGEGLPTEDCGERGSEVEATMNSSPLRRRITILQREGELLLIPPKWWHQTYHLEPSVAIAGQYLNANNERQVRDHIFSWCGVEPHHMYEESRRSLDTFEEEEEKKEEFDGHDRRQAARRRIEAMLEAALIAQHGEKKGAALFEKLLASDEPREMDVYRI